MTTRDDITSFALSLSGLSADPAAPFSRRVYLDTIAPGETPARAAEMARMSGRALTCRSVLRRFIAHHLLDGPYRTGRAVTDLFVIATQADAIEFVLRDPLPGDMLIVGGSAELGGPEHAWTALSVVANPYPDGGLLLDGLDGGQRDAGGHQCIVQRDHELRDGWDITATYRRRVRYVIDTMAIVARFGR